MKPKSYDEIKSVIMMFLRRRDSVTVEDVAEETRNTVSVFKLSDSIDTRALQEDILTTFNVWQPDHAILRDRKHVDWLPSKRAEISWGFWKRYRDYLEQERNWPSSVVSKLDSITDSILGDIGDPFESTPWDRRGMVVGDVQSGKTANYTGLICKAVDAGYKLVIVLAGMTNDLRSQTQARLDREFLGFESELGKRHSVGSVIGVGKIASEEELIAQPMTYGGKTGDFRAKVSANIQLGGNPLLLVVKKNRSVLDRIQKWAYGQAELNPNSGEKTVRNVPLLFLDDEADYASVNTKSMDEDPTSINKAIRKILKTFDKSSYVAYTATPFANIFISPDELDDESSIQYGRDLFPRNFIYYVTPPDNYIGASKIFGFGGLIDGSDTEEESLPLIRSADDAEEVFAPNHKKSLQINELPASMIEALDVFFLSCAARRRRGQVDVHNSMLIHVSRYNDVQAQILDLVKEYLIFARQLVEYRTGDQANAYLARLKSLWQHDFVQTTDKINSLELSPQFRTIDWYEVLGELPDAMAKIQARGINGEASGVLDYDDHATGLNVVAVGGDKLSRGLTLENLSVSYYTRTARNYDTLLQMGRWFGYRPGFLDLCRLYTTQELVGWYQHIAMASEELKQEFQLMERSNLTPEEYGLKVRTHPDGLNITAANKLRHGQTMRVGYSGHLAQTTVFERDHAIQNANFEFTASWLNSLGAHQEEQNGTIIWRHRRLQEIVSFLDGFTTYALARTQDTDLLTRYIQKVGGYGELTDWTVAMISSATARNHREIAGFRVGLVRRSDPEIDGAKSKRFFIAKKSNILSPSDEYIDLKSMGLYDRAYDQTIQAWEDRAIKAKKKPAKPSGPFIRNVRPAQNGLLLLYPLDNKELKYCGDTRVEVPIMGFVFSFPMSNRNETVDYQVNTMYWRERYGSDESDE